MLRQLIGQPNEAGNEQVKHLIRLIDQYCGKLRANFQDGVAENEHIYKIEAWAGGFKDSLNELEQSCYVADWFRGRVTKRFEEDMSEAEQADYQCHVYFYKNAIVRVFSVLDKLGYFMNELLQLRTESVKPRYSYFTVLREMKNVAYLKELSQALQKVKSAYKDPLNILRKKRNTEIHYVNVEMLDDMLQTRKHFTQKNHIEDLAENMALLNQGCRMVYESMEAVFIICSANLPQRRE